MHILIVPKSNFLKINYKISKGFGILFTSIHNTVSVAQQTEKILP